MLAYVTAPVGIDTYQALGHELRAALESLGATTVLADHPTETVNARVAQGADPVDASCDFVDARAATIGHCDLLVAVLDGGHPDVLVDIGMAYALGTDCYGLHLHGEASNGLHTRMLDGQLRSVPDLLALLRVHLRFHDLTAPEQLLLRGSRCDDDEGAGDQIGAERKDRRVPAANSLVERPGHSQDQTGP